MECLTIITQLVFIKHGAFSLVGNICHPNASDAKAQFIGPLKDLVPERFV